MMKNRISIVRPPKTPGYVIIDDRGIPRTVSDWKAAVHVLTALTTEDTDSLDLMRSDIDRGQTQYLSAKEHVD
jgi:hypothetical protein